MKHADRLLSPLKRRILMMLTRGVVRLVDDGKKMQSIQATFLQNETRENVEHFQNYGFSSHPLAGAECLAASIGGNRDHTVILLVDDRRYRIRDLGQGEVAVYSQAGNSVVLRSDGTIELNSTVGVRVNAPRLECTGDIIDNVPANTKTVAQMRQIYNSHTHGGGPAPTQGM